MTAMLAFEAGVAVEGIRAEAVVGLLVAGQAFAAEGVDCVVTSATDGGHKVDSLHYRGLAFDLRTHHVHPDVKPRLLTRLRDALAPLGFEVLFESAGQPGEHAHVEFDPRRENRPGAA